MSSTANQPEISQMIGPTDFKYSYEEVIKN
jgi:hypothetical protein